MAPSGAASRGDCAAIFAFDESKATLLTRSRALGCDLEPHINSKRIFVQQVDPAEMSPGEFVQTIRRQVEQNKCRIIIIDSLNGYLNAMPEERFMIVQLHEMLTYLGQQGVTTILVVAQHGMIAATMQSPVDAT